jgi:hypothetical protein
MKSIAAVVVATLSTLAMLGAAAGAETDGPKKHRVIWYSSYKCAAPTDKSAPGATPENALETPGFDEPIDDEMALNKRANDGAERQTSRFECKWVRLSGFFTPTNYYHYRGYLVADVRAHYARAYRAPRYVVEHFNDPAMRRSAIGHRQVTVVGQFYYLCLTAPKGDDIMFLFGPCHYGGVQGMMLANVRVEKIEDDSPRYLLGEANRGIIGDLRPVDGDDRAGITEAVRSWAAQVQRGPKAYAREAIDRNPVWQKESATERADARARIEHPDSYVSYLFALPAVRGLDPARAEVAAFWEHPESRDDAVGCICLQASCSNEWPLTDSDADSFYGRAACTTIQKRDNAWTWR